MDETLQAEFEKAQELLKNAANAIQSALGGENAPPPAAKARYEAITKIEEAYMWLANGVHSLLAFEEKLEKAAGEMAQKVASGEPPSLKVLD